VVEGGATPGNYQIDFEAVATIGPIHGMSISWGDAHNLESVDYNNDGYSDLLVGDVYASSGSLRGAVYTFYGPLSGVIDTASDSAVTWWGDYIGMWIESGDCNGDKSTDLLFGGNAYGDYLTLGPSTGTNEVSSLPLFPKATFGTTWGSAFLFTPDWDGDGVQEVAISSMSATTTAGGTSSGAVSVYYSDLFQ
jgi:hypothetical protein